MKKHPPSYYEYQAKYFYGEIKFRKELNKFVELLNKLFKPKDKKWHYSYKGRGTNEM